MTDGSQSEDDTCIPETVAPGPAADKPTGVTSDVPIHLMNQEQLWQASEENDRILWIRTPANVLEPSKRVSNLFAYVFKKEPCAVSQFSKVPESKKRGWYEDWKGHFWWHQELNDDDVYAIWRTQVSHRYRDIMRGIRLCREDKRPLFLSPDMFAAIRASGETEEFKRRSATNKKNRAVRSTLHTGGPMTHAQHHRQLEMKEGRKVEVDELHLHLHTKGHDGVTFVDKRAEQIHTRYREILTQSLPTPESQPSQQDRRSAFLEAAGGVQPDGSVSGLGSYGRQVYSDVLRSSRVQQMNNMVEHMSATNATEVSKLEERLAELEKARAADRAALDERLASIAELLQHAQRDSHARPSSSSRPKRKRGRR